MNKLKYAIAMLAAGGATGAGSQAAAATTVELTLLLPTDGTEVSYDITLAGSLDPQFRFYSSGEFVPGPGEPFVSVKHHLQGLGTARLNPNAFSTFSLPTSNAGITETEIKTYSAGIPVTFDDGDSYYHLSFDSGATHYLGTATIGADTSLKSITYDVAAAIPEPESWALLILGAGAAGAALRRQRRLQAAAAL